MPFYIDQIGRNIKIADIPKRIISLVPSQTELLYDLKLEDEVIGITKFCIHPNQWFQSKTRIGGTKTIHLDKVIALQPDLIIANKEENVKDQVEALSNYFPVWISDVNTLSDAKDMIEQLGNITDRKAEALRISQQIQYNFNQYKSTYSHPLRTCYLIWKDPYMSVGNDTFIHEILTYAGFQNIFASLKRYPAIDINTIREEHCELLLLSSEPYPFQQKHIEELQIQLPHTKIFLVDGEAFSWYGSRLLQTPAYLQQLQAEIAAIS